MSERYSIAGRPLVCSHCGEQEFNQGKAQLNTSMMTLLDLDWLDRVARIYSCTHCGKVEWFVEPDPLTQMKMDTSEDADCLACGKTIPAGSSACPACGWSYSDG
jgi:predicted RNA-binding Zn-ribbon protein involved in translation (DUF1610 family)